MERDSEQGARRLRTRQSVAIPITPIAPNAALRSSNAHAVLAELAGELRALFFWHMAGVPVLAANSIGTNGSAVEILNQRNHGTGHPGSRIIDSSPHRDRQLLGRERPGENSGVYSR
jgi:hypothetical protein